MKVGIIMIIFMNYRKCICENYNIYVDYDSYEIMFMIFMS